MYIKDTIFIIILFILLGVALTFLFMPVPERVHPPPEEYDIDLFLEKSYDNPMGDCRYFLVLDGLKNAYGNTTKRYISFFGKCDVKLKTKGINLE